MRSATQTSGHTRLKNSLVLRNALAAELGLNLAHVMPHLFQVEDAVGAQAALDDNTVELRSRSAFPCRQ